ncbi:MAG TPA: SGNH/GDSL hydrolase family protein [Bryobacteraceae bacterium]|nr:SGNH/GDSL hydrolase family protein [Bryobacteraceae bacterium]
MLDRRTFTALLFAAPAFPQDSKSAPALSWHDVHQFSLEGKAWADTKAPFDRLPAKAEGIVRKAVWDLSRRSAGMCVRFIADATAIHARWTLLSPALALVTMPATGVSGLDLYARTDAGRWRWVGIGRPATYPTSTAVIGNGIAPGKREYMLYLPLYNGVTSVEIGVPEGSPISKAPARERSRKPILFYGTSITQGAAASRPGMCHPAILGRRFDREVINLGFSGNGKMEPEIARLLAELDPAVYILDCLPNMTAQEVEERAEGFVRILREARPTHPILLVEDRSYTDGFYITSRRRRNETSRAAFQAVFKKLTRDKVPHLHYLAGESLLGDDGEASIDGSHPTDLGFVRQADQFEKALRKML